jgi:phosphate transport system permease protein
MNSPDPLASPKPIASMPSLVHAGAERKQTRSVGVLQRIRTTNPGSSRLPDAMFRTLIALAALSLFIIVVLIVFELIDKSKLSLHQFGMGFFYGREWDPVNDQYGALPFVYGTIVSSVLALPYTEPG